MDILTCRPAGAEGIFEMRGSINMPLLWSCQTVAVAPVNLGPSVPFPYIPVTNFPVKNPER
jgi:hypothetical protein